MLGFEEKPAVPKASPTNPQVALASMGVYVFNLEMLRQSCVEDSERLSSSHDFGKDIIPRLVEEKGVFVYRFEDENKKKSTYWRDVGTLESYWEANMDLVEVDPFFNLYDRDWPIRTRRSPAPPAKFVFADQGSRFGVALDSIVSPGCIISGGTVRRSVLSPHVHVHSFSHVDESIIMEGAEVGRHARIRRAIIEKHVRVPEHAVIGYDLQEDAKRFRVCAENLVVVENSDLI